MSRWTAAIVTLLLPVVVIGAAAGAVLPGVGGGAMPSGGAVGLAAAAAQAGFTGEMLRVAVAVGLAESRGDPHARRRNPPTPGCPAGSTDWGGWQLNSCYHPEVSDACADDLACAAAQAYRISVGGRDWTAWTSYASGAYQAQLPAADQAIAALAAPSADGGVPPGYGTPGPCGLSPATDYARHLVTELFAISDVGGCASFTGHVKHSDHYPDARGQAHAIDVPVGTDRALGWRVAGWATANAAALHVKYVLFAGQVVDFRATHPAWHACRDPTSSCATAHFGHIHVSFFPI